MKKIIALILTGVMLFGLAGCAKGSESSTNSGNSSGDTIELTMWTMHTTESMIDTLESQIEAFEEENPDITITLETLTYDTVYQRMMAGMDSDSLPNIFNGIEGHIAFMQSQDALADVTDLIDSLGGRDAFIEKYIDWVSKDGAIYGIPDWALYQCMWYRTDLFEEKGIDIPTTWEELRAAAQALTEDTDGDGTIDVYGMAIPMDRNMVAQQTYSQWLYSEDVDIFDAETGEYVFDDNKEMAVEALDAMLDIYYDGSSPEGSVDWSWTDFRNALANGEIAMCNEWGAVVAIAQEQNPDMLENLSVFPMPGQDSSSVGQTASFGGAYYMAIGKSTDEKEEASARFLEYLFQVDNVANRANSRPVYALPALKAAYESDAYQSNEMVQMFSDELDIIYNEILPYEERSGFEAGLTNSAGQIESSNLFGDAIQNVVLQGWSSEQAVDYMDEQLQQIIEDCGEMK